ncbi:MAG: hypothetical protein ACK41E_11410 [Deinococcales bacterium]
MKNPFVMLALVSVFAACAPAVVDGGKVALSSLSTFADVKPEYRQR